MIRINLIKHSNIGMSILLVPISGTPPRNNNSMPDLHMNFVSKKDDSRKILRYTGASVRLGIPPDLLWSRSWEEARRAQRSAIPV